MSANPTLLAQSNTRQGQTTEQRLSYLEEQFAAIEQRQDTVTNNSYSINAQGKAEQILEAILNSLGIVIPEAGPEGIVPLENKIAFTERGVPGTILSSIFAKTEGELVRRLQLQTAFEEQFVALKIRIDTGLSILQGQVGNALVNIASNAGGIGTTFNSAFLQLPSEQSAEAGRNNFLQLVSNEKVVAEWGETEVEWPGGNENSNITVLEFARAAAAGAQVYLSADFSGVGFFIPGKVKLAGKVLEIRGTQPGKAPAVGSKAKVSYLVLSA